MNAEAVEAFKLYMMSPIGLASALAALTFLMIMVAVFKVIMGGMTQLNDRSEYNDFTYADLVLAVLRLFFVLFVVMIFFGV